MAAGYEEIKQDITNSLMGRPANTEIQPENHQNFALELLEYTRSVELISASPLQGFAAEDTVPVQPDTSIVSYLGGVGTGETKTYTHFIGFDGNPIVASSENGQSFILVFLWNKQYWSLNKFPAFVYSEAKPLQQTLGNSTDAALSQAGTTNEFERIVYACSASSVMVIKGSGASWVMTTPPGMGFYTASKYYNLPSGDYPLTLATLSTEFRVYFNTTTNQYVTVQQDDNTSSVVYNNPSYVLILTYQTSLNNFVNRVDSPFKFTLNRLTDGTDANNVTNEAVTAVVINNSLYPNIYLDTASGVWKMAVKRNAFTVMDLLANKLMTGPNADTEYNIPVTQHQLYFNLESASLNPAFVGENSNVWEKRNIVWGGYIDPYNNAYSVRFQYTLNGVVSGLPIASTTSLGAIKVGANLMIDPDGTLSADKTIPISPDTNNSIENRANGLYSPTFVPDTAAQVLAKLLTVDGYASGLTADLVANQRDGSILRIWAGTKAQYDAIPSKDGSTIYIVM